MRFIDELNRRNVLRMAGFYLVGAWLAVQVASTVFPLFGFGPTPAKIVVIVLAIGFVPALALSWVFELTPEGLRREVALGRHYTGRLKTRRRLNRATMTLLALALVYFAVDKFALRPQHDAAQLQAVANLARQEGQLTALRLSNDQSIAVMPFVDMSQNHDQDYMSDGLAEELLNLLVKIPQLRVIARTSSFSFKGKNADIATICKTLGVAHVLEGSVRTSGDRIRITAQLIRGSDSSHLWSETYDRKLDDIFAVQDEISAAVVAQLRVKLLGDVPKAQQTDPAAYALFLKGRQQGRMGTATSLEQAAVFYKQALAIDPSYAAAWVGLGSTYTNLANNSQLDITQGNRLATQAINKALAIDPSSATAHAALAYNALVYDGDLTASAHHLQLALASEPDSIPILINAGRLTQSLARLTKAIALDKYITAQDPMNPRGHYNLAIDYFFAKRYDDAIASWRTTMALSPEYSALQYNIGSAQLLKGQPELALASIQADSSELWRSVGLPMVWHALGQHEKSDAALAHLIKNYSQEAAYNIAYVLAYRGDTDRAFEWLDKAVVNHDSGLADTSVEPEFVTLHNDPRWLPFLRKIGKAPEQLAAIKFSVEPPKAKLAAP